MKTKKILLSIPEYMYKDIERMQPYITTTITGSVLSMIEKGLAWYEKKHKKKLSEPQQTKQSKADSPDQENDTAKAEELQRIASIRWVDE